MNSLDRILRDRIASRRPFRPAGHGRAATAWGIDAATAKQHGYAGGLPDLTDEEAARITREHFVIDPGLCDLPPVLAVAVLIAELDIGIPQAMRLLERAVGLLCGKAAEPAGAVTTVARVVILVRDLTWVGAGDSAEVLAGLITAEAGLEALRRLVVSLDPSERLAARADLSRMAPVPGLEGA